MKLKKNTIFFLCFFLLSCKPNQREIIFKQQPSADVLFITPDIYASTRDSLKIDVPLEFFVENNTNEDIDYLGISFIIDNKKLALNNFDIFDYQTKEIKDFHFTLLKKHSEKIVSHIKTLYIKKEETQKIFKYYNINKDVEKFRDSVKLVSYKQFRKDFPAVIKELERIPDSLEITTSNKTDKTFKSRRIKINW